ncbi:MAG: hypothetical protein JW982_00530 [Spirochaetes bacterium]|nr:hypothetical protein [Spirochaetota bacterium]
MIKKISLLFSIFAVMSAVYAQPLTSDTEPDEWTRLTIEEVFISRKTNLDYSDASSAAEFGWHIKKNNVRFCRSSNIYATMYYPSSPDETVRLILVERDFFNDDMVSGIDLEKGKTRYTLNLNGDFTVISRTSFFPDKNSGNDAKLKGADYFTQDFSDSVSFTGNDFTDYHRLKKNQTVLLIAASTPGTIDTPDSGIVIFPDNRLIQEVFIISAEQDSAFRIRGVIGSGEITYSIFSAAGNDRELEILTKAMNYMTKNKHSIFFSKSLARAFHQYSNDTVVNYCGKLNSETNSDILEFCKEYSR